MVLEPITCMRCGETATNALHVEIVEIGYEIDLITGDYTGEKEIFDDTSKDKEWICKQCGQPYNQKLQELLNEEIFPQITQHARDIEHPST